MRSLLLACSLCAAGPAAWAATSRSATPPVPIDRDQSARYSRHAANVTIIRDTFGIAHVYGKSDEDAVFGALYAQAEDDFKRVERNYLISLGWLARAEGESAIYSDLRQRLFVDPLQLQQQYRDAPAWLKALMVAWADGLNYFLLKHPEITPRVIRHFEPWMALSFTEGSIGGDIETVDLVQLQHFYADDAHSPTAALAAEPLPSALGGSNGFAIAPARSASSHALLWINPHTSYYFRSELQMVSEQGLNVYGAATWGQFFIYQGFNSRNGWMHTSYGGDAIDEYAETLVKKPDGLYYQYGEGTRKLTVAQVSIAYKNGDGTASQQFTVYHSHHGPIVRATGDRWIAEKILQDPVHALAQSYLRTKTTDYASFRKIQDMRTDTSNNTVYADADGTIAYFHGNFIPKRDSAYDFTHAVDGRDPATEWHGAHAMDETITMKNPYTGWLANTNNWPFAMAGEASPKREIYPAYMWTKGENPRGLHAVEVLHDIHDVTLDSLIAAAYDSHLTAFDFLLPPLLNAYDELRPKDPNRDRLKEVTTLLRNWNRRTAKESIATSVAIFWGQELIDRKSAEAHSAEMPIYDFLLEHVTDRERLEALQTALDKLRRDFGNWRTPWGEINRFQRLTDDIVQPFDDAKASLPVGFASSQWGALASFDSSRPRVTRKIYGAVGNSFIAAVEFGPTLHAKALLSGGESGDPSSPHFSDQAALFADGQFRDVFFYPADVKAHAERSYHP